MLSKDQLDELREKLSGIAVSDKKRTIFASRWGLDDGNLKGLRETAHIFNMTHPGVAKIEKQIFATMGEDRQRWLKLKGNNTSNGDN